MEGRFKLIRGNINQIETELNILNTIYFIKILGTSAPDTYSIHHTLYLKPRKTNVEKPTQDEQN